MGYGDPTTTPGPALKFYASVRIDLRRIAQIKKGEEVVGNRTRAKVAKTQSGARLLKSRNLTYRTAKGFLRRRCLTSAIKYGIEKNRQHLFF